MKVWLVESGAYDQAGVDLVAVSAEAAAEAIKAMYPHIVTWSDLVWGSEESCSLVGNFEGVVGYSTKHTTMFDIDAWEVVGSDMTL